MYCREGVSLGSNSEAGKPPAPMLLSNSLFPDVRTSDDGEDNHEPGQLELGRDSNNEEETTGVSSLDRMVRCARNIFAFDSFFNDSSWESEHSNIFHSVLHEKSGEHLPPCCCRSSGLEPLR